MKFSTKYHSNRNLNICIPRMRHKRCNIHFPWIISFTTIMTVQIPSSFWFFCYRSMFSDNSLLTPKKKTTKISDIFTQYFLHLVALISFKEVTIGWITVVKYKKEELKMFFAPFHKLKLQFRHRQYREKVIKTKKKNRINHETENEWNDTKWLWFVFDIHWIKML